MDQFLSPIVMAQTVTLTGASAVIQADPTQLLNPNSTAMLIDQFRFVQTSPSVSTPAYLQQLYVSIKIGDISLTNGFVPVVTLCPTYDRGMATGTLLVWHMPRPVYVPANVVTYMNFMRVVDPADPTGSGTPLVFDAIVAGRSLPSDHEVPEEMYAPWAASTVVGSQTPTTTVANASVFVSPNNALGNPNDSDMMLTRIIGFHSPLVSGGIGGDVEGPDTFTVRMTLSNGKLLIREPTPFYHLFPVSRRFVDMRGILRGKNNVRGGGEFIKARISFQNPGLATYNSFALTMLGIIGYRTVPTPPGA